MVIFYFNDFLEDNNGKLKILSKFGDEVSVPMNSYYFRSKNLIKSYSESVWSIKNEGSEVLLVGSSLGAYMAFHIANNTKTPSLLFNPSFIFKNGAEYIYNSPEFKDQQILFSEKDEIIDVRGSIKYLNSINMNENISILSGISHHVPIDIFDKHFSSFREKYKILEKKKEVAEKKDDWGFYNLSKSIKKSRVGADDLQRP